MIGSGQRRPLIQKGKSGRRWMTGENTHTPCTPRENGIRRTVLTFPAKAEERSMRDILISAVLGACALASPATAQTWGQPHHRAPSVTWGQSHGSWGGGLTEWDGRSYAATGHAATGHVNGPAPAYGGHASGYGYVGPGQGHGYGDPRAYRPPNIGYGYGQGYGHDRGGRYGYSAGNRWSRWSSPPGRGYHDAYGYNDDRAPRGPDHRRDQGRDCDCGVGAYLYDR
jgi:hypothetical protein